MRHFLNFKLAAVAAIIALASLSYSLWAQNPRGPGRPGGGPGGPGGPGGAGGPGGSNSKEKYSAPITDENLLKLHKEFIKKAEKLAGDYSRSKDPNKARVVYEQILKLDPKHEAARAAIAKFKEKEESANSKVIDIFANKSIQDTGVFTVPGKPFKIEASGNWKLVISEQLGPNGFEVPKELKDFNLGALVGYIDTGDKESSKPFLVGAEPYEDVGPSKSGQIRLMMWDSDHSDNSGKLQVTIKGTFESGGKKSGSTKKSGSGSSESSE